MGMGGFGFKLNPFLGNINSFSRSSNLSPLSIEASLAFLSSFTLSAYLRVLRVFYELALLGAMLPIMTVLQYPVKESFSTIVSLLPRKGVWFLFWSNARMHSFRARRLLLISAPSIRVCFYS
jgi:hypothetical protein